MTGLILGKDETAETVGDIGRGAQIRTGDPLLPKQVRYRTAPRPEVVGKLVISEASGRRLSRTHTPRSLSSHPTR